MLIAILRSGKAIVDCAAVAEDLEHHMRVDRGDQAVRFGKRHKITRAHDLVSAMPPYERLKSLDAARAHADDRLVVRNELPALKSSPKRGFEFRVVRDTAAHRSVEDDELCAPAMLGLVHRDIGVPQQIFGACIGRIESNDPDRCLGVERAPLDDHGLADVREQRCCNIFDAGALRRIEQYDEFIAAEPRDHIVRAENRGDPDGNRTQQFIAGHVSQRLVHAIEAVQVDEEHGKMVATASEHVPRSFHQRGSVRQAAERIGIRRLAQLGFNRTRNGNLAFQPALLGPQFQFAFGRRPSLHDADGDKRGHRPQRRQDSRRPDPHRTIRSQKPGRVRREFDLRMRRKSQRRRKRDSRRAIGRHRRRVEHRPVTRVPAVNERDVASSQATPHQAHEVAREDVDRNHAGRTAASIEGAQDADEAAALIRVRPDHDRPPRRVHCTSEPCPARKIVGSPRRRRCIEHLNAACNPTIVGARAHARIVAPYVHARHQIAASKSATIEKRPGAIDPLVQRRGVEIACQPRNERHVRRDTAVNLGARRRELDGIAKEVVDGSLEAAKTKLLRRRELPVILRYPRSRVLHDEHG